MPQARVAEDAAAAAGPPLCVDLDGTLIATDALWESILLLVKHRPFDALQLPFWVLKGKAHFKRQVSDRVALNPAALPYREELLEFLRAEKDAGRRIVLATASEERIARGVADHLGIFDDVISTTDGRNCAGAEKLKVIESRCGDAGFDYVGNSHADLPLWEKARRSYVCAPDRGVLARAAAIREPARVFQPTGDVLGGIVKAMRPHQWAKNALLAIPLMLSHQVTRLDLVLQVLIGMAAFSFVASGIYVVNDLLDLEADRQHPIKRNRPFASGRVPIPIGIAMTLLLTLGGFGLAVAFLKWQFVGMLALYLVMSTSYTFYLKRKLLLDVFVLAGLYAHRILAGGVAAGVVVSPWLLAFSMFFFTSLAFAKRYSELKLVKLSENHKSKGRSYSVTDMEMFKSVGPTSGFLAVLVFALYVSSADVAKLYRHPQILWLACPLLMYWITRIWFLVERHLLPDDPVLFALYDRVSWIVGGATALVVFAAAF